ncbi:Hypothetical predicted protein [Pelobates cultripes]|uniref:L1 transposable element RRM domain-containing protein n=1 Tax=Pelobates cultripes TaxID=61616 RepID=A0AAD1WEM9_PELCU|nr:Hypothetical predicted protein [Pelobates cultripes]
MATSKTKKATSKAEKMNFFGHKSSSAADPPRAAGQEGADEVASSPSPAPSEDSLPVDCLTRSHFELAMETMAEKLIATWKTTADQIKREVRDLSARTATMERRHQEIETVQTATSEKLQAIQHKLTAMEERMADHEDRARRNNLRLRGVPETVLPDDLQAYARGLMRAYAPDIPADMLLVDRIHRVSKPKNLPDSIPRDVLLRAHYFHIKELVLRSHRNRGDPHDDFPSVRIMADLSPATLRRRRDYSQTTTVLRSHGIRYRWGFPTKLILTKGGKTSIISSPEEGLQLIEKWGLLKEQPGEQRHDKRRPGRNAAMD